MAPGFDPYRNSSNTGLSQILAQQNKQMREAAASAQIDKMMWEVRDMRHRIDGIYSRIDYVEAKPTVRIDKSLSEDKPSWFSRYWNALITDPFFEFLKRPSIK